MNPTLQAPIRDLRRIPFHGLLAVLLFIVLSGAMAAARAAGGPADPVRLIVVFQPGTPDAAQIAHSLANGEGTQPDHVYTRVVQGFAITLPAAAAQRFVDAMRRNPMVAYVEQDVDIQANQVETTTVATPFSGLDRIDQRTGIVRPATLAVSCGVRRMSSALSICAWPWASIQVPVR